MSGQKPIIWMQEGVGSPEAKAFAEKNGLEVVMDICIMKEHKSSTRPMELELF